MSKMSDVERSAGKRADWHVYYVRNGKRYFDAMWAPSEDECRRKFLALARNLRWQLEITKIVAVQSDKPSGSDIRWLTRLDLLPALTVADVAARAASIPGSE